MAYVRLHTWTHILSPYDVSYELIPSDKIAVIFTDGGFALHVLFTVTFLIIASD
ncbi:hypothetical protein L211DRAFT_32439 [Terfezia boudieri ATCC MYA-4762]|uniref:Uncharacterized protein n=1 Tax=Terfezia boudieri ATCC MYA-4762 TaxID=1051890 RepID=A0A3N4MBC6_9PEZI|nr:hypothetical protein L211DRAFT_32439 [Terfezia boudieri ATCC MYA-4762]